LGQEIEIFRQPMQITDNEEYGCSTSQLCP